MLALFPCSQGWCEKLHIAQHMPVPTDEVTSQWTDVLYKGNEYWAFSNPNELQGILTESGGARGPHYSQSYLTPRAFGQLHWEDMNRVLSLFSRFSDDDSFYVVN